MEDAIYDFAMTWEGEGVPEDWVYDQKGWQVFTSDGELIPDGFGSFYGPVQPEQTFFFSREMTEKLDAPYLRINTNSNSIAVFLDDELLYCNTILYTLLGTTLSLSITAMGAYALSAKRMVGHKFFSMMIVFTMFFQGGMIPTYLVVKNYGLLDTIWAVILPGAVSTWNFIVMRSFFDNYPSEIEESGRMDGLTDAGVFFRLVLPTSKAVMATIGLYYAVSLWNAYFTPFIYLNDPDLFPLQLILHELLAAGSSNNATVGVGDVLVVEESLKYATVLVSIAPIMCVYPFLQKYFVKGVMIGSVKG